MSVLNNERCPAVTQGGTQCKNRGEHKWQARLLCGKHLEKAKLEPLDYVDRK